MPQRKKRIADSGYKHFNEHIANHREEYSKEMTNHINCVRAHHKNIYFRLKVFNDLSNRLVFVVARKSMTSIIFFEGCLVLVQYDVKNGHSLVEK